MTKKTIDVQRSYEQNRYGLLRKVKYLYDLQRLRIQTAGRIQRKAEGAEIQLHEVDIQILTTRASELEKAEKLALRDVADHLKTIPFWRDVLSDKTRYKGVGPSMGGVILASFDIRREDTPSKMWAFAGLRPLAAVRCALCHDLIVTSSAMPPRHKPASQDTKCGLVNMGRTYSSGQAQRPVAGEKLPYNAWLRMKLVGVLGPVLLKCGSPWRKVYDGYKHRKESQGWGKNDGHRHQAAIRFMIKMLLLDIWKEWRAFEKLPVRPSYHEEKQGHVHHQAAGLAPPVPDAPPEDDERAAEIEAELASLEDSP
jgi:hypothetical protein